MYKLCQGIAIVALIALLSACSPNQGGGEQATAPAPGTEAAAPAAEAEAPMEEAMSEAPSEPVSPGEMIDHSGDLMEFELKKALAGVESLLEDYAAAGHDTAELEAQKAELEGKLAGM